MLGTVNTTNGEVVGWGRGAMEATEEVDSESDIDQDIDLYAGSDTIIEHLDTLVVRYFYRAHLSELVLIFIAFTLKYISILYI
jgi:hypothetical protein